MSRSLVVVVVLLFVAGCVDWGGALDAGCHANGSCGAGGGSGGALGGGAGGGLGGGTGGGLVDAGEDAGIDAGVDAGLDAGTDGGCARVCVADGGEPPHMVPACLAGACGLVCEALWGDCNDGGVGCLYSLAGDSSNCGACGRRCGNAHTSSSTCSGGSCLLVCAAGFADCNADPLDGCETDLTTTATSCGSCGFSCGAASCTTGVCVLASAETRNHWDGYNALAADATKLYWTNLEAVRVVGKDGQGLASLYARSDFVGSGGQFQSAIAVDQNSLYVNPDTYEPRFYQANKLVNQTPTQLSTPTSGYPVPNSLYVDGDATRPSTALYWTNVLNGAGLYRYNLAAKTFAKVQGTFDPESSTKSADELYWAFYDSTVTKHVVRHVSMFDGGVPQSFGPFTYRPWAMAAGPSALYLMADSDLHAIDALGNDTVVGHCPGAGNQNTSLAVFGSTVYIAGSSGLYRLEAGPSAPTCRLLVSSSAAGSQPINSVVVDSSAVYFGTPSMIGKTAR